MSVKALVALTSEESKRLIAKAISKMEVVEKAKREGIIGFTICSSAGFVAEEVLGESLDLSKYYCGFVHENGMCAVHADKIQGYPINQNLEKLRSAKTILYDSIGAGMTRSSFLQRKK